MEHSRHSQGNYIITAYAWPVPSETDTTDNTLSNGPVMVTITGDANGDRIVTILDAGKISAHWYPNPPIGPLGYGENADINNDGAVDISDATIINANWHGSW